MTELSAAMVPDDGVHPTVVIYHRAPTHPFKGGRALEHRNMREKRPSACIRKRMVLTDSPGTDLSRLLVPTSDQIDAAGSPHARMLRRSCKGQPSMVSSGHTGGLPLSPGLSLSNSRREQRGIARRAITPVALCLSSG